MFDLTALALVFGGGGLGSVARYALMLLVARQWPVAALPLPTLAVNVIGAFVMGILLELLALRVSLPAPQRLLLITGFLGGFTTFSAFSLDCALLLERGDYTVVAIYIGLSIGGTIVALFAGSGLIRAVS